MRVLNSLFFVFFFAVPPNKRSPQPQDKVGNQVVRLGNLNPPPPVPVPGAVELGAGWGVRPPNPPTFYYITRSCVLSSLFRKIFFFFFYYIPPFIISHSGSVCQVFFKKFLKKIFHFSIDFCFLIWYNYYRN